MKLNSCKEVFKAKLNSWKEVFKALDGQKFFFKWLNLVILIAKLNLAYY